MAIPVPVATPNRFASLDTEDSSSDGDYKDALDEDSESESSSDESMSFDEQLIGHDEVSICYRFCSSH